MDTLSKFHGRLSVTTVRIPLLFLGGEHFALSGQAAAAPPPYAGPELARRFNRETDGPALFRENDDRSTGYFFSTNALHQSNAQKTTNAPYRLRIRVQQPLQKHVFSSCLQTVTTNTKQYRRCKYIFFTLHIDVIIISYNFLIRTSTHAAQTPTAANDHDQGQDRQGHARADPGPSTTG